ncbi:hypothetical protein H0H92_016058 [Tricholoma furcatifolium]|nr:hypothetical protein H0H92_016058 [Tricholoma furcatifolium]
MEHECKALASKVAQLQDYVTDLEGELADVKKERDKYRELLSTNRNQVAELTSLTEAQASQLRDLQRQLDRLQKQHSSSTRISNQPVKAPNRVIHALTEEKSIEHDLEDDIEVVDAFLLKSSSVIIKEEEDGSSDVEIIDDPSTISNIRIQLKRSQIADRDLSDERTVKRIKEEETTVITSKPPILPKRSESPQVVLSYSTNNPSPATNDMHLQNTSSMTLIYKTEAIQDEKVSSECTGRSFKMEVDMLPLAASTAHFQSLKVEDNVTKADTSLDTANFPPKTGLLATSHSLLKEEDFQMADADAPPNEPNSADNEDEDRNDYQLQIEDADERRNGDCGDEESRRENIHAEAEGVAPVESTPMLLTQVINTVTTDSSLIQSQTSRTNSPAKQDVSQFLDLEAEVSGDDDDDDDDQNDLADFINDDDSVSADSGSESEGSQEYDPSSISHRAIAEMMSGEEATLAWHLYLDEEKEKHNAQQWAGEDPDEAPYFVHHYPDPIVDTAPPHLVPDSLLHLLPRPDADNLDIWRVSVKVTNIACPIQCTDGEAKRGREESLAFTLFRKAMSGSFNILSVIGRVSCPGWIYIEAKELRDVQYIIDEVPDIHKHKIHAVPSRDASAVLHETPFTYPTLGSWVHIDTPGLYRGIWLGLPVESVSKQQKGKRAEVTRIPQQRLDVNLLASLGFEVEPIEVMTDVDEFSRHRAGLRPHIPARLVGSYDPDTRMPIPHEFLFQGSRYIDGYAILSTSLHKPAIPTREQLIMFKDCSLIPPSDILALEEKLDALRLRIGDPVKITGGEAIGALGQIVDLCLDNSESTHLTSTAVIETSDGVQVEVAFESIRKILAVGDSVVVVDGLRQGFAGWIVCIEGANVHLFDDITGEGISVGAHQVMFHEAPKTKYKQKKPDIAQAPADFHFSNLRFQDITPTPFVSPPQTREQNPHRRFVGRRIQITKGPFKDYLGIIKNTERGDLLNVELQATLQQQQFNLQDMAHADDPELRPLIYFANTSKPLPYFAPIQTVDDAASVPSAMPLVPSTPIPEDSSAAMGRAWNPSSRTPNPRSGYPCNSYMDSDRMNDTIRVHVVVAGTKPVLQDPGWKAGDWEGRRGLWSKCDNKEPGYAFVRIGLRIERVPERYITPTLPTIKGQHAMVIDSADTDRFCKKYYVLKYIQATKVCEVRPAGKLDLKSRFELPASSLAVVS